MNRTRIRPHHLVIGFGVAVALFTALSGVAAAVFDQHDESTVTREVFGNIPTPAKVAFYTVLPLLIIWGAVNFANRMKNWQRGQPDNRRTTSDNVKRRMADVRSGLYMQTLLREPGAGVMHSLIYFPFIVLLGVTTTLEINHQLPEDLKFLHGRVYQGYSAVGDIAGILFLVGVGWAIVRRYGPRRFRPYRIRIKSKPEHAMILGTLFAIGVTGFGAEMFRIALQGTPDFEKWSIIGYPLALTVDGSDNLSGWHQAWWYAHILSFVAFLVILPVTMLRHIFTSPLNMYLKDRERPKGAMKPLPNLMETELETFGAAAIEDFTWKQLLDTDACTMCGRCTSVCPAHATGKPLDPREIVLKTGEVMAASGTPAVSPPLGVDPEITVPSNWVFDRITPEEVWACTSCKACDEICPVNIEILDKILDMRRYLSLMESNFPTELGNAYRSMENSGNPWGISQAERADWATKLEGITVLDGGDPFEAEYLYWVGCAGSFDDKNTKVTQSMAKLLQRAGIDFAILGPAENCTGDPARRSGNEYIFQMLAMQNIETLDSMGVRKIITQCPHCFNTLQNEYPQLGGHYEVVHHSSFLEELIDDGRLDVSQARLDERVVYHDSCYLGRHNDIYLAPRRIIGSLGGVDIVEAPRNGTKGMCCGAGGARMWMEENIGPKVNDVRAKELLDTGATRVATACPFCYIMMDDGVKGHGVEDDQVQVGDIAMHLLEAIETGEARAVETQRQALLTPVDTTPVGRDGLPTITLRSSAEPAGAAVAVMSPSTVYAEPVPSEETITATAADGEADDLKRIKGVGPVLERLLHDHGIVTFEQIAAITPEYEARLDQVMEFDGRITRENWRSQAAEFAAARPARTAELPPLPDPAATATPAPTTDDTPAEATAETSAESAEVTAETAAESAEVTADEPEPRADAATPAEAEEAPPESPAAQVAGGGPEAPAPVSVEPSERSDDLSRIKGTDPHLVRELRARGITSYAQIAALDDATITALEHELGIPGRIQKYNWRLQAELLQ